MTDLSKALSAETLKARRTLTLGLAFLAPLAVAFIELAMMYQEGDRMISRTAPAWLVLGRHTIIIWSLLMLPLFVTLETGLLAGTEHNSRAWKQLFALPLPRWTVYSAKQIIALGMIGLSTIVLVALIAVVGLLLSVLRPDLGFSAPFPFGTIALGALLSFLPAWLIISLHMWVASHWSSFVVAMGVGISATVAGVLVASSDWANYYPWTLPGLTAGGFMNGLYMTGANAAGDLTQQLLLGVVGGIVLAIAGCWETTRRDVG